MPKTAKKTEYVEVMDTTLRDGEQTPGVSYTPAEKLQIAGLLLERAGVDRIEIASARVSEGELEGAKRILAWAKKKGKLERVEILGFVDKGKSIEWIKRAGGRVINLLTKGSLAHCTGQLRKKPEEHFREVCAAVDAAAAEGLSVNIYLEDWSGGMRQSPEYVFEFLRQLAGHPVKRLMLPDTLGILQPSELREHLEAVISRFPDFRYDFHGHNDYGLGAANCLEAVRCGVSGVHVTVNGLGERTGNPSLSDAVAVIHDMTSRRTRVKEGRLKYLSEVVEMISGKRVAANTPVVGEDVFTQTCGVHADGDKKGNLYASRLTPERFGRNRKYALGKLSGKASIDKNLEFLGMELSSEARDRVLEEVVRLGEKKKKVTAEDLPFIVADVLKTGAERHVVFSNYQVVTGKASVPQAEVEIRIKGKTLKASAKGDGGYDAVMKAVRKALKPAGLPVPKLLDYEVRIPRGGKSDALVETTIVWENAGKAPLVTIGVDTDQLEAAIEATEKMLNIVFSAQHPKAK